MREISLREYQPKEERLSEDELSALTQAKKDLGLSIAPSGHGKYTLRPSSVVGAVEVGGLSVIVEPKIGVGQLISLACYAMARGRKGLVEFGGDFAYAEETALPEFLARAFADAAEKAFAHVLSAGAVEHVEPKIREAYNNLDRAGNVEVKFTGPDGVTFDLSVHGWAGTQGE